MKVDFVTKVGLLALSFLHIPEDQVTCLGRLRETVGIEDRAASQVPATQFNFAVVGTPPDQGGCP